MGVTPLRNPPVDNSSGIMHVRYLWGDRLAFIQRVHLNTHDRAGVVTAFTDYAAKAAALYDDAWLLQLSALDSVIGGDVSRVPCPVADDVPGSGSVATTGIAGLTQTIFVFNVDFPEEPGLRARLRFVGVGGSLPGVQVKVDDTTGGTAADRALVAYAADPASPIVDHSGAQLILPATKNTPLASRERQRSMRAA